MFRPQPIPAKAGQESVWDYPRPPRLELSPKHLKIIFNGVIIADTKSSYRVLETSHPPVYYLPPQDIKMEYLQATAEKSFCEWKGLAGYYNITVGDQQAIKDYLAFYPAKMTACYADGELVQAQPGNFYGGWITSDVVGPFKGVPNSWGW